MGVQGFPTLKIVRPSKKPGKPIVEDYQGGRKSKDIVDFVKTAIPNNVKKIADKGLSAWLDSSNDTSKAILFSNKGTTGALIKVLATEYLGSMNFAQIRDKEKAAVEMFGVTEYPTLVVLPGGTQEPVKYDGQFSKDAMKDFLGRYASSTAQAAPKKQRPTSKEPEKASKEKAAKSEEDASSFSDASTSHASADASEEAARATSVVLEDESNPTESPNPIVTPEEKPIQIPNLPEPIPALIEQKFLQEKCLGEKTSTCVLALLPIADDEEGTFAKPASSALASLAELAEKHVERGSKLFPFYSIPARNTGAGTLRDALKLGGDKEFELVAVNARRGWWRRYEGEKFDVHSVENWIDNIRFGEGQKGILPGNLIVKAEEEPAAPTHGEL